MSVSRKIPTARRRVQAISAEELQRRSLSRKAAQVAESIENVSVSIAGKEARTAELEAMFSNPELYDDPARIAASGQEYRVLKEETASLWEEWERLSVEADKIDNQLTGLKSG